VKNSQEVQLLFDNAIQTPVDYYIQTRKNGSSTPDGHGFVEVRLYRTRWRGQTTQQGRVEKVIDVG